MDHSFYLLVPLLLPAAAAALLQYPFSKPTRRSLLNAALALELVYALLAFELHGTVTLAAVSPLALCLSSDHLSKLFSALFAGLFWAFGAGKGETVPSPFQAAHCLLTLTALMGLCYAGNLFTFLLFFLLLTGLLLWEPKAGAPGSRETAGRRSRLLPLTALVCTAALGLGSVLFALRAASTAFCNGGVLNTAARLDGGLQLAAPLMLLALLGWTALLPPAACYRARPRLPLAAGVLPCAGMLGLLRVTYYLFGSRFFLGSQTRTVLLCAAAVLLAAGGLGACLAKPLEQRLAFLSMTQSACAVTGLFLLRQNALWGAVLQCCVQAAAMLCLLLCAASFRDDAGRSALPQLRGMGRQAPVLWGEFTLGALALAGLPPFAGFTALYYLVLGGAQCAQPWDLLCIGIALLSAVFPLVSLGPTVVRGIWPGKGYAPDARVRTDHRLLLALGCLLAALAAAGLYPAPLLRLIRSAAISIL